MNLLLDSALKATVILFAAWTAALALRRASADVRHIIWLMATLAVAILPMALSIPQSAIPAAVRIVVPVVAGNAQVAHKLPWLLIVWAAGASIMLLRLIAGIIAAERITSGLNREERQWNPLVEEGLERALLGNVVLVVGALGLERRLVIRILRTVRC